jgi:tetratricopeptide (TPR) repeat protein
MDAMGSTLGYGNLPGRARDVEQLVGRSADLAVLKAGAIVFLAGDDGSGRGNVLAATAAELEHVRQGPLILAGRFDEGRYVAQTHAESATESGAALVGAVLEAASTVQPLVGLAGQLVSASLAAHAFVSRLREQGHRENPIALVPRLLRAAAEEQPTVCLIDQADDSTPGWWGDVVLSLATEIPKDRLPLLLVLSVTGPAELGEHHTDEPDGLYVARHLTNRKLADWQPLLPISAEDIRAWTGPISSEIINGLLDVTGGRAAWIAELWTDWKQREVVTQPSHDRAARFAPGRAEDALAPIKDLVNRRLVECLGPEASLPKREEALRLLAVAALEGRRFSAETVGEVLGDLETIRAQLDRPLARNQENPAGFVTAMGQLVVDALRGNHTISRYEFAARLDWLTLRRYGFTDEETLEFSRLLATAVEHLHQPNALGVSAKLAQLHLVAGNYDRARHYRRVTSVGIDHQVILWRAERILEMQSSLVDRYERTRAADILIDAVEAIKYSASPAHTLQLTEAAVALAEPGHQRAFAWLQMAQALRRTGAFAKSHEALNDADRQCENFDDRVLEAQIENSRGSTYLHEQAHEQARLCFQRTLELKAHPSCENVAEHHLAQLDILAEDLPSARLRLERAHELAASENNLHGALAAVVQLVRLGVSDNEIAAARPQLDWAIDTAREIGDRHAEASVRLAIGEALRIEHRYDEAREQLGLALSGATEVSNTQVQLGAGLELSYVLAVTRDFTAARQALNCTMELALRIGQVEAQARATSALQRLAAMEQSEIGRPGRSSSITTAFSKPSSKG